MPTHPWTFSYQRFVSECPFNVVGCFHFSFFLLYSLFPSSTTPHFFLTQRKYQTGCRQAGSWGASFGRGPPFAVFLWQREEKPCYCVCFSTSDPPLGRGLLPCIPHCYFGFWVMRGKNSINTLKQQMQFTGPKTQKSSANAMIFPGSASSAVTHVMHELSTCVWLSSVQCQSQQ